MKHALIGCCEARKGGDWLVLKVTRELIGSAKVEKEPDLLVVKVEAE